MSKSYELTDDILNDLVSNVKENHPWLENNLLTANWELKDADKPQPIQVHQLEDQSIAKINKAYRQIEKAAKENYLTDLFRTEKDQAIKSRTARSLEKTIARFARQHSILQAHSC